MMSKEKIQPEHLERPAFVYVRQSNPGQVRHHHKSRRLQYGLAEHARALGWRNVMVIDDDQGRSATSTAGRLGFQRLVATVGLGQAGAIFGIDVARLARNNRDWYQVLVTQPERGELLSKWSHRASPRQPAGSAAGRRHWGRAA